LFEVKDRSSRRIQGGGGEPQVELGEPGRSEPQTFTHLVHELSHTGVEASTRVDLHLDAAQVSRRFPEDLRSVERDLAIGADGNVAIGEDFEDPAPSADLEEGAKVSGAGEPAHAIAHRTRGFGTTLERHGDLTPLSEGDLGAVLLLGRGWVVVDPSGRVKLV
jgi:hypothetical protein